MVVLDGGTMVTIGGTQYLQPDYLSPLPTTLDAKKSPLALLAQTCSQIGADSSAVKPLLSLDKTKKSSDSSKSPSAQSKTPKSQTQTPPSMLTTSTTITPTTEIRQLAFKPYETNVLTKSSSSLSSDDRPSSKSSSLNSVNSNNSDDMNQKCKSFNGGRVPSRNKSNGSPEISVINNNNHQINNNNINNSVDIKCETGKSTPTLNDLQNDLRKSVSPSNSSQRGQSPIIRSGLEVLHGGGGQSKDLSPMGTYKPGSFGMNSLAALCCPPGSGGGNPSHQSSHHNLDHHAAAVAASNPAFRPPFGTGFSHHHAAMLAAAAAGYHQQGHHSPSPAAPQHPGPYVSYARVKTPSGGEAIVPVCKDPYCTGCQYSAHNQQMMMGAPCPAGCTQCEQQKFGLAMAMSSLPPNHPYAAAAAAAAQLGRPYICNWIVSDTYCGKRFTNSEELLQHLRTHTASLSDPAAASAALAHSHQQAAAAAAMMHPLGSIFNSSLHRAYAQPPPLSPMSAAAAAAAASRYHPYGNIGGGGGGGAGGKLGQNNNGMPTTMSGSPYAAFNPALNPYYSPYAIYGQRIGAAAVHP